MNTVDKDSKSKFASFFTTVPGSILIGSLLISFSILLSGGIIKIKGVTPNKTGSTTTTTTTAAPAPTTPQGPTVTEDTLKSVFTDKHIMIGNANAKNLLVEVADPSCPYCHAAAGLNPTLSAEMGAQFKLVADGGTYVSPVQEMRKLVDSGDAAFVYIYTNGHGNGEMATKALYCANEQGKFWEVHDKLMTNEGYKLINEVVKNDKAKSGDIASFLSDVYNQNSMKSCLDSGKYDSRLAEDSAVASGTLGVSGTPGFYVNTTNFAGAYSWTDMKSALKN